MVDALLNQTDSAVSNADCSNLLSVDGQELSALVGTIADQKFDSEIAKLNASIGEAESQISQLVVSMDSMDHTKGPDACVHNIARIPERCETKRLSRLHQYWSDGRSKADKNFQMLYEAVKPFEAEDFCLIQLCEALKPLGAVLWIGVNPMKLIGEVERYCEWHQSDFFHVVLTVADKSLSEADEADEADETPYIDYVSNPACAAAIAIAGMVPGSLAMPDDYARRLASETFHHVTIECNHLQEFITKRDKCSGLREQLKSLFDARDRWQAKKENIPKLEKTYLAKIAAYKLNMTPVGRDILKFITEDLIHDCQ